MDIASEQKGLQFVKTFSDIFKNSLLKSTNPPNPIWQNISSIIKRFSSYLKDNPLALVIMLHAYQSLYPFLQFTINQLLETTNHFHKNIGNEAQKKNIKNTLNNILNLIYSSTYSCFLEILPTITQKEKYAKQVQLSNIFKKCMKLITTQKYKQCSLTYLLKELAQISVIAQPQQKRKCLNSFITYRLMVQKTNNYFEEIALNWIKKKVEMIQSQNPQSVCCHILFEHKATSQLGKFSESLNQQFKDYHWPLQNQSIKFHLTKTIVGFLNTTGGIIYVGLKQDKKKMIQVKGIKLNSKQKIDFLYFLHNDIMKGVYPKQQDRKKDEQDQIKQPNKITDYQKRLKQEFQSSNNKFQYRLNKYVHVDFIDIYDGDTLLNLRQEGCGLYIARIKIKIGDKRQLYHVINIDKHTPQAYLREEKSVKKKSLQEFYTLFYQRMKNNEANVSNAKTEQHAYCRFNLTCTQK